MRKNKKNNNNNNNNNKKTHTGTRRHVTYSNMFQTSGRVGENCRFAVRDCRRAHNRTARARHCVQLQLFLSQRDWPRRHAIAKLQPRHQLPLSSRYFRWVYITYCAHVILIVPYFYVCWKRRRSHRLTRHFTFAQIRFMIRRREFLDKFTGIDSRIDRDTDKNK